MRVTIGIPTLNRIHYLRDAVRSVAAQSFTDYEVVISDNSADPAYTAQVEALIAEHPQISFRLLSHPRTIPMVDNANFLVDQARGDYWIYLPDDDRLRPDCLERLVAGLEAHPQAEYTFADHWIMRADGSVDEEASIRNSRHFGRDGLRTGVYPHETLFDLALRQAFVLQSMLFRRETIQEIRFDPAYDRVLDFDLQIRLANRARPIQAYYCAERLIEYRVHQGQTTGVPDVATACRMIIKSLERCSGVAAKDAPLYRRKLAQNYFALARAEQRSGQARSARRQWWRGLRVDPTYLKGYLYLAFLALPRARP